jgi:hypothetical protein
MRLPWIAPLALTACLIPPDAIVCYYGCAVAGLVVAERGSVACDLRLAEAEAACAPRRDDPCRDLAPPCRDRPGCELIELLVCTASEVGIACADVEMCRSRAIYERRYP